MRKSDKVQRYLRQLERELAEMPDGPRAGVLTEVHEQIKRGLAGDRSAGEVLRELGSPKLIAMSHMKVRPASAEAHSPWRRVAAITTVLFFGMVFAFALHWIRQNANRRLKLNAVGDRVTTSAVSTRGDSRNLREFKVQTVVIPFSTGRITLNPSPGESLAWTCEGSPQVEILSGTLTLNLDVFSVARCEVSVPDGVRVELRGTNGHLDVKRPRGPLEISLVNGRVNFSPDPSKSYNYDVHVKNGLQDFFRASSRASAIKIKIALTNGTVKKE